MLATQDRLCDCCGKLIPYNQLITHMEYDSYTTHILPYKASIPGDPHRWFSDDDEILGLVTFHIFRGKYDTITPYTDNNLRCKDICLDCKIKILKQAIEYIEKHRKVTV